MTCIYSLRKGLFPINIFAILHKHFFGKERLCSDILETCMQHKTQYMKYLL